MTITVDAVVYFRIFNPIVSVTNVENAQYSTRLLAATTLRNILGTKTLQEILQDRESIAHHMQVGADESDHNEAGRKSCVFNCLKKPFLIILLFGFT